MGSIPLHYTDVTFLDKNIKITLAYMSQIEKKNLANFLMIVQRQHFKYNILLWILNNISI